MKGYVVLEWAISLILCLSWTDEFEAAETF